MTLEISLLASAASGDLSGLRGTNFHLSPPRWSLATFGQGPFACREEGREGLVHGVQKGNS